VAGNETTTSLIASAMLLLLQHPGHLDALRAEPARIPNFIEEALRFESPVHGLSRVAKIDAEVGGVAIPAGAQLVLMYGSANRDERHFAQPEKFAIDRENAPEHFAFGGGIHYCLGAHWPASRRRSASSCCWHGWARSASRRISTTLRTPPSFTLRGLKALHLEFIASSP